MTVQDEAIAIIKEARQSHVEWAEHLEQYPDWRPPPTLENTVGEADHHREWVTKYDTVLAALRGDP